MRRQRFTPEELDEIGAEPVEAPKPKRFTVRELQEMGAVPIQSQDVEGVPTVGPGETWLNRSVNIIPGAAPVIDALTSAGMQAGKALGIGESSVRFTPEAQAEAERLGLEIQEDVIPEAIETYRNARDIRRLRDAAGADQNPRAAALGTATGIGLSMLAPLPAFRAAKLAPEAGLAARTLNLGAAGAKTGAAYGALAGATLGPADLTRGEIAGTVGDTLSGAGFGAGFGAAAPLALGAGQGLFRAARGSIRPSPAAQTLIDAGADRLTIGQMAPRGFIAQAEEIGASTGLAGEIIKAQRKAGRQSWQRAVLREAGAPGFNAPRSLQRLNETTTDTPIDEVLEASYRSFEPAYAPIKATPMGPPGGVPGARWKPEALASVVDDPALMVDDAARATVRRFLTNQASIISKGELTAERLMAARSNIRDALRKARKSQNFDRAELLERAEERITEALTSQIGDDGAQALRRIDAQYRQQKILEDAVAKSGDQPDGFTPNHLSLAVKATEERGAYARGAGGPLRKLAAAGKEVLEDDTPLTGARALFAPPVMRQVGGALSAASNVPAAKKFLLGQYAAQRPLQALERTATRASRSVPGASISRVAGAEGADVWVAPPVYSDDPKVRRRQMLIEALRAGSL